MNTKEKFVITINREVGSGGRTVGEKLAEKLGVSFYDKAVIKGLTEKYNLTPESIERLKGVRHTWWSEFRRSIIIGQNMSHLTETLTSINLDDPNLLTGEDVFKAESEILKGIADAESCVIAGRSGFFVLKDYPNRLSILIQASMPHRIERIMEKQKVSREDAGKIIARIDQMRENYVKNFAHTSRYDTRNYDLVISMDGKSEDEVADLILRYIGK